MSNNPSGGCGCQIVGKGTALQYTHDEIEYCPLHANAEKMLEALKEIVNDIPRIHAKQYYENIVRAAQGKSSTDGK